MEYASVIKAALGGLAAAFWLWFGARAAWFLHEAVLTKRAADSPAPAAWPRVSVVVPARNEGANIGACLTSLLAMNYPNLEVIAVNDRSTDATGTHMELLAAQDSRLRCIHVTELPQGWLGKTHAMYRGAQRASGDFLLFTDGDVLFATETLCVALRYVQDRGLDHLCLMPKALPGGYWENGLTQFIGMLFVLSVRPWAMARPRGAYAGVGAFNLVRAETYSAIGGYKALRTEIIDDMRLGRAVRAAGGRSELLVGDDLLQVRWQVGVAGLISGVEKNSFATMEFSWPYLVLFSVLYLYLLAAPYAGIFLSQGAGGWIVSLVAIHALFAYWNHRAGIGVCAVFGLPVAMLLCLVALWRSATLVTWRGGILWRETFYPLSFFKPK